MALLPLFPILTLVFVGVTLRLLDVMSVSMVLMMALWYVMSSGVCVLDVSVVCSLGVCVGDCFFILLVMRLESRLKLVLTSSVRAVVVSVPFMTSCGPTSDPASSMIIQSSSCFLLALMNSCVLYTTASIASPRPDSVICWS